MHYVRYHAGYSFLAAVDIWVEYVHFAISYMAEPDGSIEKVRTVFERALMAAGLHVPKGDLLWESYREFEQIILSGMVCIFTLHCMDLFRPRAVYICVYVCACCYRTLFFLVGSYIQMSICEEENADLSEQLKRVANLFKRQLSVPLLNMEKTFIAFEEWLDKYKANWTIASGKPDSALVEKCNVELAFKKALSRLQQIKPYEEVLVRNMHDNLFVNVYSFFPIK